jgi:anti-anti-sigma factor
MNFVIRVSDRMEAEGGTVQVVRITGELDEAARPQLQQAEATVDAGAPRHVVFDLTDLSFLSGDGFHLLLAACQRFETRGAEVHLVGMRPSIERVFVVMRSPGTSHAFRTHAELEQCLASVQVRAIRHPLGSPRPLEVTVASRHLADGRGVRVVRISGAIDQRTEHQVRGELLGLTFAPWTPVILDLELLAFVDSTGVSTLLGFRRRLEAKGTLLVAAAMPAPIRKVFSILGTLPGSKAFDTVEQALAHLNGDDRDALAS